MTPPLWTVEAMARAMGAARGGALPASVNGISIDSRSIGAGDAFFAIKGDNRDGHEFVSAALKAGAGLAVVAADCVGQRARRLSPYGPRHCVDGKKRLIAHAALPSSAAATTS